MQLESMHSYAAQRGWTVVLEVQEIGSGSIHRPKRELLMKAARRREIDIVLVWRLDRWGRSVPDLAVSLKELNELGVALYRSAKLSILRQLVVVQWPAFSLCLRSSNARSSLNASLQALLRPARREPAWAARVLRPVKG
jgi:hypothetical protein